MNIEKEKELFLYELKGHGYHFKNTDWYDDWERFEDEQLNMVWEMWISSANRQGYKLVPVEPTYKQLDALKNSCELFKKAGVSDLEGRGAYKAMIGEETK